MKDLERSQMRLLSQMKTNELKPFKINETLN